MEDFFKIGVITASHGVRGEMKVYPTTDNPARFKKCKEVYLETKEGRKLMKVESARIAGEMVLLKLEGINAPEEVTKLRNSGLFVDREHAVSLSKNEYFIADLIGIDIYDESDTKIGVLQEVLPTGANDVYQIELIDGRELLLPAIKDCILKVDIENNQMQVHVLPGLLDD